MHWLPVTKFADKSFIVILSVLLICMRVKACRPDEPPVRRADVSRVDVVKGKALRGIDSAQVQRLVSGSVPGKVQAPVFVLTEARPDTAARRRAERGAIIRKVQKKNDLLTVEQLSPVAKVQQIHYDPQMLALAEWELDSAGVLKIDTAAYLLEKHRLVKEEKKQNGKAWRRGATAGAVIGVVFSILLGLAI